MTFTTLAPVSSRPGFNVGITHAGRLSLNPSSKVEVYELLLIVANLLAGVGCLSTFVLEEAQLEAVVVRMGQWLSLDDEIAGAREELDTLYERTGLTEDEMAIPGDESMTVRESEELIAEVEESNTAVETFSMCMARRG